MAWWVPGETMVGGTMEGAVELPSSCVTLSPPLCWGGGGECVSPCAESALGAGSERSQCPVPKPRGPSQSCFLVRPRKPHSEHISCLRNSHSRFRNFIPKSFSALRPSGSQQQGEGALPPCDLPRRLGWSRQRALTRLHIGRGEGTLNPVILE